MNNLFKHIEYLLLGHDCIIVPGFGAFILSHMSAAVDLEAGRIVPPSSSLMFNQAVSADDGLLANSYARKYGLNFEEARNVILKDVAAIKGELTSKKELTAGNLGKFFLGEEGNMMFVPDCERLTSGNPIGFFTVNIGKHNCQLHNEPDESPLHDHRNDSNSAGRKRFGVGISKSVSKIAALMAVAITFAIAIILNPIPRDDREQRASVVPVDVIMNDVKKDCEMATPDTVSHMVNDSDNLVEPQIPTHYLIVATFKNKTEAEAFALANSTDEYKLHPIESRKLTRVAAAQSSHRKELQKLLNSRNFSSRFPNSWIWSEQ